MNIPFEVEQVLRIRNRGYVIARPLVDEAWSLSDSASLGGFPIAPWTHTPRALGPGGSLRDDLFVFEFPRSSYARGFAPGQIVLLSP